MSQAGKNMLLSRLDALSITPCEFLNTLSMWDKLSEQDKFEIETEANTSQAPIPVITLTLNDKSEYVITQQQVNEWSELYPAVDVMQSLRNMKGWLYANPTRRKTKSGILRFISGWLAKNQNQGDVNRGKPQSRSPASYDLTKIEAALNESHAGW